MSERTSGIYSLITFPAFYAAVQRFLGGDGAREAVRARLFPDLTGKNVLEIGCGPGTWVPYLHDAGSYCGIDWNESHITAARKAHSAANISFINGDLADPSLIDGDRKFDLILAIGILHHLDDDVARATLKRCADLLSPDGSFIAFEPVYHDGQHVIARWLKNRDSGRNIRREEEYRSLTDGIMPEVETEVVTDMMRLPYSHCILRGKTK
jgi:SAM-dependent methyltransferase